MLQNYGVTGIAARLGPLPDEEHWYYRSRMLQRESHHLIPGGCHTYAKGDDQFPLLAPGFIARGKGSRVWDVDGNEYIEYGSGCRAVTLGHAHEGVVQAVQSELQLGTNFTRPAPLEVECARQFLSMISGAEMVKFCKDGSSATTAAFRLARAYTDRDKVAFCADHHSFSDNDWFIGRTQVDSGIPQVIKDLSLTFRYNDIDSVRTILQDNPNEVAALLLEPAKYSDPEDDFLHKVQDLCDEHGVVFILDEMITGFRWHNGGAQAYYDIVPDLSTFGKAVANGFSLAALAGKRKLMELGGLMHDQRRVFLLSTTHGAEIHSLAAGIATMRIYECEPVVETLHRQGTRLKQGLNDAIDRHQLQDHVQVLGKPCCMVLACRDQDGQVSQGFRTLILQETIRRGILMPSLAVSYAHSERDIDQTINALDESLYVYRKALNEGFEKYLVGRPSKVVYRAFN